MFSLPTWCKLAIASEAGKQKWVYIKWLGTNFMLNGNSF